MKTSFILLLCCALAFAIQLNAQTAITVSGIVKDEQGNPLPNVSVREPGAKKGTITKEDGRFSIAVKDANATLEFIYVGYAVQKLKLSGKFELTVALKEDTGAKGLKDVVVVGGQSQTKRTTTTAISSLSGKTIENLPAPSVDVLLQGRISGMNVQLGSGEPGVAPTIVVRGNSKVSTNIGNNNVAQAQSMSGPLYVIDGIPLNPEDISNAMQSSTGTNYLAGININDIESVDVQKDAAATAAWGSRGANGVIYIKTKRGRSAVPEFRVNVYAGVTQRPELIKTYTGAEERQQKMNVLRQYATPAQLAGLPQILTDSLNPYFNNATDWQGLFYRNGSIQNVDATVSAANELVNYRVSMNYYNEKGIIEAFGYKRYSLRGNFDFKVSPKLNSQLIVAMSKGDRQRGAKLDDNSESNTPFSGSTQPSSFYRLTAYDSANFSGLYSRLRNKNVDDFYSASLTLNYAVLPTLKYTFQGAANVNSSSKDYFRPSNIVSIASLEDGGTAQPSYAESDRSSYATYFLSNTLNFSKKLKSQGGHVHNFLLTGAQQFSTDVSSGNQVKGNNVPSNDIQVVTGIPQSDRDGGSYYSKDALLSLIGQLQYDYDGRYLLYGSYRGDASSRFGNNTKWGYFPAVGAGWVVSDEPFMKNTRGFINFLKFRASYGISGSQSSNFYAPFNSYTVPGNYNGSTAIQPSYDNGLTKNNLTWAKTEQKNVGLDFQLFNSRITFSADVYDKISKDDYYNFQLPFYTGFQSLEFNAKDLWVSNRGVDITISTKNLSSKSKLQWNSQLVLTFNKNAIAKLPNNNRTFVVDDGYGVARLYAVGQPIYQMFQMRYLGVYNYQSEIPFNPVTGKVITYFKGNNPVQPGYPIWEDVDHDGDVWTGQNNGTQYGDRVPTGNPNPKFTGGFTNDFTYKNFSLSITSVFTWKREVVNTFFQEQMNGIGGSVQDFAKNRLPDISSLNYWTPAKAAAKSDYRADFPSINPYPVYFYQFRPFTDMWNVDGSYFKVKYVVLSYQLPQSILKRMKVKSIRAYGMMDNVLIIKNKNNTMPDPEAVNQLGVYTGGLFPQPRKITLGLDIQF